MLFRIMFFLIVILFVAGCSQDVKIDIEKKKTLFTVLDSDSTGIDFVNEVNENAEFNYLTYEGYYQGAGVGIGDFNNDGLQDIFFAGNSSADRLYLNKGNLKFEDFTSQSGILQEEAWSTGVTVVDINNDNLQDIYVTRFLYKDPSKRQNRLYINRGGANFVEAAANFGLADQGYSIHATFFDYDKDGDLDVYVVNQPPTKNSIRYALGSRRDLRFSSKLYENRGEQGFQNVTSQAGLLNFGYSLNAMVADYNGDGWQDIYISNDFEEADFYFVNQGDGTFKDEITSSMRHISNFSMGADAADLNNDGRIDLMVADMVANDPFRQKTNMASMNPRKFEQMKADFGIPQYMYNSLQANNGANVFSEIAHFAGVAYSDWSWAPLIADFDLDGDKDIIISNGIIKDVTNKDILSNRNRLRQEYAALKSEKPASVELFILDKMPSIKLANQYFENKGDFKFTKGEGNKGLDQKTWTQGMAYADFDNDGDLDLVYNNAKEEASILRNNAESSYINFKFSSLHLRTCPIGTSIQIYHGDTMHSQDD